MTSKVEVISDAFILLGKGPVNTIDNGPPVVDAVSKLYDLLYPTVLSWHPWRFAMAAKTLSPLTAAPPIDKWAYAYLLPSDLVHLYGTYPAQIDYGRYENYIYANEYPTLTIEYSFLPSPLKWPIYFKNLMVLSLASYAAMTITQDENIEKDKSEKANQYLLVARTLDSQQQPSPKIERDAIYSRKYR